jgi:general secretion pathway protein I
MSRAPNESGFSLVEALVALAVFAMAGVALVQLQSQSLITFARVETRALADIAAQNRLTEIVSSRAPPPISSREDQLEFAGRTWRMTTIVTAASDPRTRRVSVSVSDGDAAPSSVAHAFVFVPEGAL